MHCLSSSWKTFTSIPTKLSGISLPKNPLKSKDYQCLKERVAQAWTNGKTSIIATACAWAIIITWAGSVYGFTKVAKNLSIGLGIGMGTGLTVGALMFFIKLDIMREALGLTDDSSFSLINFVSANFKEQINNSIMVSLVTTIFVSMTMNALPQFPLGVGCIAGFFTGQRVAITCGITPKPTTQTGT